MTKTTNCSTCKHWKEIFGWPRRGDCTHSPPRIVESLILGQSEPTPMIYDATRFPITHQECTCGQWTAKT